MGSNKPFFGIAWSSRCRRQNQQRLVSGTALGGGRFGGTNGFGQLSKLAACPTFWRSAMAVALV